MKKRAAKQQTRHTAVISEFYQALRTIKPELAADQP
jgi:hypothetical protein